MAQKINPKQMTLNVNGVEYQNCYLVGGTVAVSVAASDMDYDVDTGVAKFPNNLLASGITPAWTTVTWNQVIRAALVYQSTGANLRISCHIYAGSALSKDLTWWAIGN